MKGFDLNEYVARTGLGGHHLTGAQAVKPVSAKPKKLAPGQTEAGVMNKTEMRWWIEVGQPLLRSGEALAIRYEEIKFKLGQRCFYTPDFRITWADETKKTTYIEVKGAYIREKGLVKFKMAADKFREDNWQLWQWISAHGWTVKHDL